MSEANQAVIRANPCQAQWEDIINGRLGAVLDYRIQSPIFHRHDDLKNIFGALRKEAESKEFPPLEHLPANLRRFGGINRIIVCWEGDVARRGERLGPVVPPAEPLSNGEPGSDGEPGSQAQPAPARDEPPAKKSKREEVIDLTEDD